jgi:hypothetical protein
MDWLRRSTELASTVARSEPLDYHVWGYIKAMVYAHKVNVRKELLSKFSALQEASVVLQWFTSFQVLWSHKSENVSKQMEATSDSLHDR